MSSASEPGGEWLLLVHQLPPGPSNARVKTWRRLQDVGAVALRNAAYVLPNSAQAREDFAWVRADIIAMRGEATIFAATAVDEADRSAIVEAFRAVRTADFDRVRMEIERLTRKRGGRRSGRGEPRLARRLGTLAQSLRRIEAVDFFSAPGGEEARQALAALEEQMTGRRAQAKADKRDRLDAAKYARRVWVTRRRPGVDRMSSAWLIRRFIDPHATFTFAARDSTPAGDQVAFDMFTGEFTHEADRCTFEVLLQRFGLDQPALRRIAGIVHDIDLKEQRYQAAEAPTIAALVEGVRQSAADDHDMLDRGMSIFEALYRTFETAPAQPSPKRRRPRT